MAPELKPDQLDRFLPRRVVGEEQVIPLKRSQAPQKSGLPKGLLIGCGTALLVAGSLCLLLFAGVISAVQQQPLPTDNPIALVIRLDGVLIDAPEETIFGEKSLIKRVSRLLERAKSRSNIKAVVLYIDSPGGGITTSDRLFHLVEQFKQQSGKPVVTMMGSVCASGGYYVAMSSDFIMAYPTTMTGSFGVILSTWNVEGLTNGLGIQNVAVMSEDTPYKDILSPFRKIKKEERKILSNMVNSMYNKFLSIIEKGRPNLSRKQIKNLADGSVWAADDALSLGLVDKLGYMNDLRAKVRGICNCPTLELYEPPKRPSLGDIFGMSFSEKSNLEVLKNTITQFSTPRLMFIWRGI